MTPIQAKKLIKTELDRRGLSYTKLTARTVGFVDLARDSMLFVTVHGWQPHPAWEELKTVAVTNGFRLSD